MCNMHVHATWQVTLPLVPLNQKHSMLPVPSSTPSNSSLSVKAQVHFLQMPPPTLSTLLSAHPLQHFLTSTMGRVLLCTCP